MSIFTKILGIIGNTFQIGGPSGPKVMNDSGAVNLMAANGTTPAVARGAHIAASAQLTQLATALNLQSRVAPIDVASTGAGAPSPGDNTGKFIFIHTTGGSYTAGDILYDDGAALVVVPFEACRHVTTNIAVTGTINLIVHALYAQTAYRTFSLIDDGISTGMGQQCVITVPFAHDSLTPTSTTVIPAGAVVLECDVEITEVFEAAHGSSMIVVVDGAADETIADSATDLDMTTIGIYQIPQMTDIAAGTTGPVLVTVTLGTSATGEGRVHVRYATPAV